jgi:hypothetical protein
MMRALIFWNAIRRKKPTAVGVYQATSGGILSPGTIHRKNKYAFASSAMQGSHPCVEPNEALIPFHSKPNSPIWSWKHTRLKPIQDAVFMDRG